MDLKGFWGNLFHSYKSMDRLLDREQWTKDIHRYLMLVLLITIPILAIGTAFNLLAYYRTYAILVIFVVSIPFWWGANHGGWKWARFFPSALSFGIGIYAAMGYLSLVSGLFFAVAIVLAGMLVSLPFQRLVVLCSAICFTYFSLRGNAINAQENLGAIITSAILFIAIALLQWYYDHQLHNVLQTQAETHESLYAEMEHNREIDANLFEKEKQLRRLTDNSSDLVGEISNDGVFIYTTPSYYSSLGYEMDSLVGINAFTLIHPEDQALVMAAVKRSVETGKGESAQLRFRCANGTYKWFETLGSPLFTDDHRVEGFVISSRDITRQKYEEELRAKSEERERNIINSIPMGMHMYELKSNGDLIFVGYNPAAELILNISHAPLIGKTIEEAFPSLVNTDIPEKYAIAARDGIPYDVDPVDYSDEQVKGAYEVHAFRTSPMKMVAVFRDVTERNATARALHNSEEKFKKAFHTSPDSVNINRLVDGVYIDINEGFTRLTGYERDEVLGKSSLDLNIWANPADRAELVKGLQASGIVDNLQAGFTFKDGQVRTGLMSARVIDINNEKCILSITRDISDRVEAQEKLNEAHHQLAIAYEDTLEGWVRALDLREHETADHSRRVVEMTRRMIKDYDFDEKDQEQIYRGALLHDIGKMGVPDSILLKPGPLTDEEWVIMRNHPQYALDLMEKIPYLLPSIDIPFCHHERWDGSGYPRKIKGEEIPLAARIFAVVDVYDALLSNRPYRKAWREPDVIHYLREQMNRQFDARIVEHFLKIL